MDSKNKKMADELVCETLKKVRKGWISREEGREEIKATLRRFNYDEDVIEYAIKIYRIHC